MRVVTKSVRRVKMVTGVVMALLVLPSAAVATEKTTTQPWWLTRSGKVLEGAFYVMNSAGHAEVGEGKVKVKVLKRKDGKWKLITKKTFTSRQEGTALWSFPVKLSGVPTKGRCKVVGRYMGSEQYAPSKAVVKTKCGAKTWYQEQ